jgi:hypothetical protein
VSHLVTSDEGTLHSSSPTTRRLDPLLPRARLQWRGAVRPRIRQHASWPPPHAPPSSPGAAVAAPSSTGCGGSDSGRGAAAPSLLVPSAEAEARDLARCGDSLPTRVTAQAPDRAAEVRQRRTEQCGRHVVVVALLAWGTEDRRPAAAWSWPGGGGPRPVLLFFFFLFSVP